MKEVCNSIISLTLSALFTCAFDFHFFIIIIFKIFRWRDARSEKLPLLAHFVMEGISFPFRLSTAERSRSQGL